MSEDIKNQAAQMLRRIDNPILQGQVTKIQNEDPMEELKKEVLSFFKTKIAAIKRSEAVKELVYNQLESKIQGGELEFDQLMQVLARLDNGSNDSADSIISMFRPTANGTSALTEIVRPAGESSDIAKAFAGYSSEDLQAIEKTMRTIRIVQEANAQKAAHNTEAEKQVEENNPDEL